MSNPSKARGTAWESNVATWFRNNGHPYAERRALHGNNDQGDIAGIPGIVIECKSTKTITLSTFVDELAAEMANADAQVGAVVIKRRGTTDPGQAYAVMPLHVFNQLLTGDLG